MPRRGEHQRVQTDADEPVRLPRVGVRVASVVNPRRLNTEIRFDPASFQCRLLAAELADEWVDYCASTGLSIGRAAGYRRAIDLFCQYVDDQLGDAAEKASLGREEPDLGFLLSEWERTLASSYAAGSNKPAMLAADLRGLMLYRGQHDQRPVTPRLRELLAGMSGVLWGRTDELDEFSRQEKRALTRAAWAWTTALQKRLDAGWQLASEGGHPAEHGWASVPNLLWGLANDEITAVDIRNNLPPYRDWPPELQACVERSRRDSFKTAKLRLIIWLVRQLFPHPLDMSAFRGLLVITSGGAAPEELTGLSEDDVEFIPGGVRLTLTKRRAGRIRPRRFLDSMPTDVSAEPLENEEMDYTENRRDVSEVIRRLLAVTEHSRRRAGDPERRLFIATAVKANYDLSFARWNASTPRARFRHWAQAAGVELSEPIDIRRLRKSCKVEKALAFGGRVADAADDHHEETFRGHYAQGTTLRVLSAKVITTAQDHWFTKAVEGPTAVADTEVLDEPERLAEFGLTTEQVDGIRQGELDMGLSQCKDPFDSPFSRSGELCAVAPLRCLECRNAWILPSNLPQLLLFADHLDGLRLRPEHFAALWGQVHANLTTILADRTEEEKQLARKHIEAGEATLHLPLTARTEFDA